jgi:gliding motility-associated-like protein
VEPTPLAGIQLQTVFCEGLTVDFINLSDYATEFIWDFGEVGTNDISLQESPTWTYSDYGTYQVLLFADPETQCEDSDTAWFVILPPDPIDFDFDISAPDICDTTNQVFLNFTGSGADLIVWDMGDGNTIEGAPASYIYDEPGLYTIGLTATNTYCEYDESDQLDVFYGVQPIDKPIKIPNVFSPNEDLKNDRYRVFYSGETTIPDFFPPGYNIFDFLDNYQMQIYDRWGVLLFDTSSGVLYWDGLINNDLVSEGTYYYVISYRRKCIDNEVETVAGPVTVLYKK